VTADFEAILRTPFRGPWRRFTRPVETIVADRIDDVVPALEAVDAAVRRGLYAAGFVAYEAAAAFGLPAGTPPASLPLVHLGVFSAGRIESLARFPHTRGALVRDWRPSIEHREYLAAIDTIKSRIEAGDTYQINFTFRLGAPGAGDPKQLMADLYAAQHGAWSAYLDCGAHVICSASPELFFLKDGSRLECRPMKGTAARGWWPEQDRQRGRELQRSEKNRAENVMIVDMVRNDLGRIAEVGSVRAESLFDVERYPLQWQMTSRVAAAAPAATLLDIFAALFPSASITGAPKHSAMRIISGLETTPRGVYTGAVGYVSPHGRAHFNVAIRTAVIDRMRDRVEFGVGSGIVWDSVDRDEYEECLIKASMVLGTSAAAGRPATPAYVTGEHPDFQLLETLRWSPEEGFRLLERHLARLRASAACFAFTLDVADLRVLLDTAVRDLSGPAKVRLCVACEGGVACEAADLEPLPDRPLHAALAADPVDTTDVFLFHKTTRRHIYDRARRSRPGAEAVILWNDRNEITEATDFNVVVEMNGSRVTPPVECGLLPGTFRAQLLDSAEITERRITIEELHECGRGWLINSVRGWVPFTL
jgi:para-aminobenzoate synthetase/4-amino-4-deoxychorismate lyase